MQTNTLPALAGFIGVAEATGGVGAIATAQGLQGWYQRLDKPAWTPPSMVFGPVWTSLYALMGTSAWLVWQERHRPEARVALGLWGAQLALNGAWSPLFFGARRPDVALADIGALDLTVAAYALAAGRVSKPAAWLVLPYLAWIGYATALNASIWRRNRGIREEPSRAEACHVAPGASSSTSGSSPR
jgi:tryptophan-rich sensory protein